MLHKLSFKPSLILLAMLSALSLSSVTLGAVRTAAQSPSTPTGTPQVTASPAVASSTATPATAVLTNTLPSELTMDDITGYGPGDFNYPDPSAGLADLSAYTTTLTLRFQGIISGQPYTSSTTYVTLATKNPTARQVTIERSRATTKPETVWIAETDGVRYTIKNGQSCSAQEIVSGSSLPDPTFALDSVTGAVKSGSDSVNGVPGNHYTFDQRALGQDGLTQADGDLWVASQGGYLLRYQLTRNGQEDYYGQGITGTETISYALTLPTKPIAVEIPPDCPSGTVNAPLLPDATNVVRSLGLLTYNSAKPIADAVAFYQKELPGEAWVRAQDPVIAKPTTVLVYRKENRDLTVTLTTREGGGTQVALSFAFHLP